MQSSFLHKLCNTDIDHCATVQNYKSKLRIITSEFFIQASEVSTLI